MDIADLLRKLEGELLDSSVRKNAGQVATMLAEDFQEFGSSGRIFTRAQIIAELQSEVSQHIRIEHFRAQALDRGDRPGYVPS